MGNSRAKRTLGMRGLVFAAVVLMVVVIVRDAVFWEPATSGGDPVTLSEPVALIGHAGVGLKTARYTNSKEALDAAVARGIDRIEIDFLATRDGVLVGSHDWQSTYLELHPDVSWIRPRFSSLMKPAIPSRDEFLATPMRDGLTGFDAAYLGQWLRMHPQVKIITDTKDDNITMLRILVEVSALPLDQFIVQIYRRSELEEVRRLGFSEVIYTLYKEPNTGLSSAIGFAREHGLALTIPVERVTMDGLREAHSAGVPIYVHTINSAQEALQLKQWGASAVYTDFLVAGTARP